MFAVKKKGKKGPICFQLVKLIFISTKNKKYARIFWLSFLIKSVHIQFSFIQHSHSTFIPALNMHRALKYFTIC